MQTICYALTHQCAALCTAGFVIVKFVSLTSFPLTNHDVVLLPGCDVIIFVVCPLSRNIVTAIIDCGSTGKSSGSDTASPPSGIIMDVFPLKVTVCKVFGWMAETPAEKLKGRATVTAVMGRFVTPNALEKRRRICEPPTEVCSV